MTPKPKSKKLKKSESKQKKIRAPKELRLDVINETLSDSLDDVVEGEPNREDRSVLEDISDDDSLKSQRRINRKATSLASKSVPSSGITASNIPPVEENAIASNDHTFNAELSNSRLTTSGATSLVSESSVGMSNATVNPSTVSSTATSGSKSRAYTGTVPKIPSVVIQAPPNYELPREKTSWYDETEKSQIDDMFSERRNPFSRLSKVSDHIDQSTHMRQNVNSWQPRESQ